MKSFLALLKFAVWAVLVMGFGALGATAVEKYTDCITFTSKGIFSLNAAAKGWDGTLYWSTDQLTWTEWTWAKATPLTAAQTGGTGAYNLYVRGDDKNTKITGSSSCKWVLTTNGVDTVACSGNIETLRGAEGDDSSPTQMADSCYNNMFSGCAALTAAPALPATTLADGCYCGMFLGCSSLTNAPALSATTLTNNCYKQMFKSCTSLTEAPALSSMALAESCYYQMFYGCASLTAAPVLPATKLAASCYYDMFNVCKALTAAPALPAAELSEKCYYNMFKDCTSLTAAPALPATTLTERCYNSMFSGCTSLTSVPALPATTLANYCYYNMFNGCASLIVNASAPGKEWKIPAESTSASSWGKNMFTGTGGDVTGAPVLNTTYYIASVRTTVTPQAVAHATFKVYTNGTVEVASPHVVTWGTTVKVTYAADAGYVFANGTTEHSATFAAESDPALVPEAQVPAAPTMPPIKYTTPAYVGNVASNGIAYWTTNEVGTSTVVTSATSAVTWGESGATNWYVVHGADVQIDGGVTCVGHVNLILCDGAKLTVTDVAEKAAGIATDPFGSFAIYGQPDGAGELEVTGGEDGAGIGGGKKSAGCNITINGGTVTATGGPYAAAIGGGKASAGLNITINGGTVMATGGRLAAGIGGGNGDGSRAEASSGITINSGVVTAIGDSGIGGGSWCSGEYITINGGTVTATGLTGAGIGGGGIAGAGEHIAIKGGTVSACSLSGSAAIGSGIDLFAFGSVANDIALSGGTVFVSAVTLTTGGAYLCADIIGCGLADKAVASDITISSDAKVCFNLTGVYDMDNEEMIEEVAPMPAALDGFVIMTPETPVERVLVGGCAAWTAAKTFALTNAATGATRPICVGGGAMLGDAKLKLTHANETLAVLTADGVLIGDAAWAELSDGICTIFGTGDMWSYEKAGDSPLWDSRSAITNLVVSDGVTGVGSRFFENMWWLKDVSLGGTVTNVAARAFKKCYGLTNVTSVATGALTIGDYVFSGCHSLQAMTFADTPTFGTESYSLQTAIYMDGDIPRIYPIPQVVVGEQANALKIAGKVKLEDATWEDVTESTDEEMKNYHFFKVVMP